MLETCAKNTNDQPTFDQIYNLKFLNVNIHLFSDIAWS